MKRLIYVVSFSFMLFTLCADTIAQNTATNGKAAMLEDTSVRVKGKSIGITTTF